MKQIKHIFVISMILAAMLVVLAVPAFADDGGYEIKSYDFDGTWSKNNVITVTETIKVNFYEKRHGIYRSIPTVFYLKDNSDGESKLNTYKAKVTDITVDNEPFKVTHDTDSYKDIKIGDKNTKIRGNKTYTIHYKYQIPDDRISSGDVLYFTVLGSGWNTDVEKYTFSMNFERALSSDELAGLTLYSGEPGDTENSLGVTYKTSSRNIHGYVNGVPANNAITIFANVHEGYFTGEHHQTRIISLLFLALAIAIFIAIIVLAIRIQRKKTKYEPTSDTPDKLCPAEVGTIVDETVDDSDILSMIPWFADNGYLRMEEAYDPDAKRKKNKKYFILHKVQDIPADSPKYQKTFFYGLFPTNEPVDLRNLDESFAKAFDDTKEELEKVFTGRKTLSTGGSKAALMSFLLGLAICGFISFSDYIGLSDIWIGGLFVAALLPSIAALAGSQKKHGGHGAGFWGRVIGIFGASILALIMTWAFATNSSSMYSSNLVLGVVLMGIVGAILSAWIIRPTDYKLEMLAKIRGLEKYIKKADVKELEQLQISNSRYFYQVLPYAMVFGLSTVWAKHFINIKMAQPEWYQTTQNPDVIGTAADLVDTAVDLVDAIFDPLSMLKDMNEEVTGAIQHSYDSFKASSSDGGSAGGGGGGGGGGSW